MPFSSSFIDIFHTILFYFRTYPQYRFHHLRYHRSEFLFLEYSLPKENSVGWHLPPTTLEDNGYGTVHQRVQTLCGNMSLKELKRTNTELFEFCNYEDSMKYYSNSHIYGAFMHEMLMSLANLYVGTEASGFVGTWTSNWCTVLAKLVRTRGDGGLEYHGVDRGSFFSDCYY